MSGVSKKMLQAAAGVGGVVPEIGAAYAGGFFAGQINDGGTIYNLVISPKSSGENSSKAWKTANTSTSGTDSNTDGSANTASMNNATHPAAQFCAGLSIDGFSDWYLPARYELEICYYNLKPTTASNTDIPSFGDNPAAVPPRTGPYTNGGGGVPTDPPRTSVGDFRSGGSEAFDAQVYWSSTQETATATYFKLFTNGSTGGISKTFATYVRAMRREPA